ncbi:MAG: DUF2239 family protein, partial [Solimonas sp.]
MSASAATYTSFDGNRLLARGPLAEVAVAVKHAQSATPVLIFDDASGRAIDLDLRGTDKA